MSQEFFPKKLGETPTQYNTLKESISALLQAGRAQAAKQVNTLLVQTYWHIGRYIVEFEQKGEDRANYGDQLLETLSKDLTAEYGKGFSRSNLFQIRKLYLTFPIIQTPSGQFPVHQTLSEQFSWSYIHSFQYHMSSVANFNSL